MENSNLQELSLDECDAIAGGFGAIASADIVSVSASIQWDYIDATSQLFAVTDAFNNQS